MPSLCLILKALPDPDTAVADNSVLLRLVEMLTAFDYWFLHSTLRCLDMTVRYLFVTEQKVTIAEEEED